jgi:hypothetical protein
MGMRTAKHAALALFLASSPVMAGESHWDRAGNIELQSRFFTRDAVWPGQASQVSQVAFAGTAELHWRNNEGDQRASIIPYLRWDSVDDERNLVDLQEAYWARERDSFELLAGVNTVFWGVTESVHLVDIVNQTDAAGDIDSEDKLGQPMVSLAWQQDWGMISAYVLPYFRERNYPGVEGRLRTPLPVDTDRAVYESSRKERHVDLALRYSHYIGDVDIGLSIFSGTSREPRLVPADDAPVLLPHYDQVGQFGTDLQYTRDAWLWKLEAIVRNGYSETFAAAVGGLEYTFFQVGRSAADLGFLLEYQYDGRNELEPFTIADNDIFAGLRLALNDIQDTSLLAGIAYDTATGETFFNVEGERRIGDSIALEVRARVFSGAGPQDLTYAIVRDDYVQIQLAKYF